MMLLWSQLWEPPSAVANIDLKTMLSNAFNATKSSSPDKNIKCCIPVEYGGFNSFAPIYLALNDKDVILVDAEGSGRAVPGLDTTLLSVNNCAIDPFVLTNEKTDSVVIRDCQSAVTCEESLHI